MNLKQIRKQHNMTQQEVADALGCSSIVYGRYETGKRQPSADVLIRLADVFDVSIDYLLGYDRVVFTALTPAEKELIEASREADDRARADVLKLLKAHKVQQ